MRSQTEILSPRDLCIKFEEKYHTYSVNGVNADISVTKFIGRFYNPFDRDNVCERLARAEKSSIDFEQKKKLVLSDFNLACKFGSKVHDNIDRALKSVLESEVSRKRKRVDDGKGDEPEFVSIQAIRREEKEPKTISDAMNEITKQYNEDDNVAILNESMENNMNHETQNIFMVKNSDLEKRLDVASNAFISAMDLLSTYKICATEYMVWDDAFMNGTIAGTIDCLFWSDIEKREIILVDWKTNKSLTYSNKIKVTTSPFYDEYRTTLMNYFCQLHLYQYILEKNYNVKVVKSLIVHVRDLFTIYQGTDNKTCKCLKVISQ